MCQVQYERNVLPQLVTGNMQACSHSFDSTLAGPGAGAQPAEAAAAAVNLSQYLARGHIGMEASFAAGGQQAGGACSAEHLSPVSRHQQYSLTPFAVILSSLVCTATPAAKLEHHFKATACLTSGERPVQFLAVCRYNQC